MANTHSIDLELSSSQYLDRTHAGLSASFPGVISTDFTIEAWVKLEQLPSTAASQFTIISKDNTGSGNTNRSWDFFINTSDELGMLFSDGSVTTIVTASSATFAGGDVGTWVHVAVSVDISAGAPGIVLYKNASTLTDTDDASSATALNTGSGSDLGAGCRFASGVAGTFFDGLADEFRVWSDIRTGTEITNNYQQELTGAEANLEGYWQLNNDLLDATGNGNTLTNNNSAVFSTDVPFSATTTTTTTAAPTTTTTTTAGPTTTTTTSQTTTAAPTTTTTTTAGPTTTTTTSQTTTAAPTTTTTTTAGPTTTSTTTLSPDTDYSRESNTLRTDDNDLATLYSNAEDADVATENSVYVDQSIGTTNATHLYKKTDYTANNVPIAVKLIAKSSLAPTLSTVFLQIWDDNGSDWETLSSDSTTAADTNFTLTGTQSTSLSNYYSDNGDGTYTVAVRTYQAAA